MDIIISLIYGIVQSATEFLPVSSSGHLVIMHRFLPLPFTNELLFDVILHLATVIAVCIYFRKDILMLFKSVITSLKGKRDDNSKLGWLIIIATIPAALAGWLFSDYIEAVRNSLAVVIMLILVGILLIIIEKKHNSRLNLASLTLKQALFIGLAQAVALIPGTSRSAITIIAGMAVGLKRQTAIRFSFLLLIPIVLGANLKLIPELLVTGLTGQEWILLIAAFIITLLSGILVVRFFLAYARKHSLVVFGIYRIIIAIAIIIFLF